MWNKKHLLIAAIILLGASAMQAQWSETGMAAHYADKLHGQRTAGGELYDKLALTAAHHNLPIGSRIRVTRLDTQQSVEVRVNDCCVPFKGRIVDLSRAAAERIDLIKAGTARVRVDLVSLGDGKKCGGGTAAPVAYEAPGTVTARGVAVAEGPVAPGTYRPEAFNPIRNGYGVQVGAFSSKLNADAKVEELKQKGFKDLLVTFAGADTKVPYKVLIGPFDNRESAAAYNKSLGSRYKMKGMIVDLKE